MEEDDGQPLTFGQALDAVLERNEASGKGPTSLRALARDAAMVKYGPSATPAQREDWRRALRRYHAGEKHPRPATVEVIAKAAGATVEDFPPPQSRESRLRSQVEDLRRENDRLRGLLDRRRGRS